MDKEISRAIGRIYEQMNDMGRRIDNLANSKIDKITPYKETKTAYIDDTEIIFENIPQGNLSVFVVDSEGNYPNFTVDRVTDRVTVSFDPCQYITTVTISIL